MMQLEMLIRIVEERSFVKAAARVLRTQPALSLAIKRLENELGRSLFNRSHRHDLRLTEAGEILYETASRIIGLRDEALTRLCPELTGCTGRISIGVCKALGSRRLFPELIGLFHQRYPRVRVDTISDGPPELLAELTKRNVELVLLETQPETNGLQDHLTATPVRAFGQKQTAWAVQHRRGRSHLSMEFNQIIQGQMQSNRVTAHLASRRGRSSQRKIDVAVGLS